MGEIHLDPALFRGMSEPPHLMRSADALIS